MQQNREDERFLEAVFDGIQDGISVLDSDLNVVRVNHAMQSWYEHALPIAGKKCYAAYHLRERPCDVCPTIAALMTGQPQTEEVPLTGPEGVRGCLELHAFPLYGDDGRITGAIEYVRDITIRKQAEAARRESDERLKVVMDNIPGAIFWKDRGLVYLGCNRQFAQDGGLSSPDDIIGKTALDMPWAVHADLYHADDREVMESDTPKLNIEEPLMRADGTQRWLRTNKIPMHDAGGQVIGVVTTYEDITQRKQMEQYVLQNERLAAMGRMAAALAHEVNNPLHAIGNAIELVLDFPLEAGEQRQYLRAALLEIERLQALARSVLGFARPPHLERRAVDIAEVVDRALAMSGRQLQHSRIAVDLRLPGDLPRIVGSRDRPDASVPQPDYQCRRGHAVRGAVKNLRARPRGRRRNVFRRHGHGDSDAIAG